MPVQPTARTGLDKHPCPPAGGIAMVIDYFTVKLFPDDPARAKWEAHRFWDRHKAGGWKVGRVVGRDWQAMARTWRCNNYNQQAWLNYLEEKANDNNKTSNVQ